MMCLQWLLVLVPLNSLFFVYITYFAREKKVSLVCSFHSVSLVFKTCYTRKVYTLTLFFFDSKGKNLKRKRGCKNHGAVDSFPWEISTTFQSMCSHQSVSQCTFCFFSFQEDWVMFSTGYMACMEKEDVEQKRNKIRATEKEAGNETRRVSFFQELMNRHTHTMIDVNLLTATKRGKKSIDWRSFKTFQELDSSENEMYHPWCKTEQQNDVKVRERLMTLETKKVLNIKLRELAVLLSIFALGFRLKILLHQNLMCSFIVTSFAYVVQQRRIEVNNTVSCGSRDLRHTGNVRSLVSVYPVFVILTGKRHSGSIEKHIPLNENSVYSISWWSFVYVCVLLAKTIV